MTDSTDDLPMFGPPEFDMRTSELATNGSPDTPQENPQMCIYNDRSFKPGARIRADVFVLVCGNDGRWYYEL